MSSIEIVKEIESNLLVSLNSILPVSGVSFDGMKARQLIVDYVLNHDKLEDNDARRYEKYFNLTEKARLIAEGWLKNCASEVKHYEETEKSLKNYLFKTYGKN